MKDEIKTFLDEDVLRDFKFISSKIIPDRTKGNTLTADKRGIIYFKKPILRFLNITDLKLSIYFNKKTEQLLISNNLPDNIEDAFTLQVHNDYAFRLNIYKIIKEFKINLPISYDISKYKTNDDIDRFIILTPIKS